MSIPQRKYGGGAARDAVRNQDLLVFAIQGGSYISVTAALNEDYTGLIGADVKVLEEVGQTLTLRLEVRGSYLPRPRRQTDIYWLHSGWDIPPKTSK